MHPRRFIAISLVLFTEMMGLAPAAEKALTPAEGRLKLEAREGQLNIESQVQPGQWVHLMTYQMPHDSRPYLHPVHDTSGHVVLTEDQPADHRWQHGIFTGFHRVNGFNYWKEDEGKQRFVRLLQSRTESNRVSWSALVELVAPDGKVVLEEEDRITVHAPEPSGAYMIDFDLLLRAKGEDVQFGKFFVGGLSVRMPWEKENPRQAHLNSNGVRGREGEQKRASWCTVERTFGAETFGFAILDHPANAGYPSVWRVDEQGLINPNISGLADWMIPAKEERLFRYRLVVYRGSANREQMAARFDAFTTTR